MPRRGPIWASDFRWCFIKKVMKGRDVFFQKNWGGRVRGLLLYRSSSLGSSTFAAPFRAAWRWSTFPNDVSGGRRAGSATNFTLPSPVSFFVIQRKGFSKL